MSLARIFARRIALGAAAAWSVLTTVFLLFTATKDWVLAERVGLLRWAQTDDAAVKEARQEYLASRGLDRPLWQQYLDWMGNMATLNWGESLETGEAVLPIIADATARTAMYVLPAIVLAVALGLLVGLYAAIRPESRLVAAGRGATYLFFALPAFWVGGMFLAAAGTDLLGESPRLFNHVLPIALTTATLLGGYVSYTRAHAVEYASADFVKLVRAKGASDRRVAAHVLRNAAIPVFSMLFTEALGLLVLSVFVIEVLFGIEGFGLILFRAVEARDLPVLLGGTIVTIGVGVLGNVVQDVSYTALDPRVDTGSR
ncbi:MAG: ABC transporter permease [Halobacteriales archaeon]